MCSILRSVAAKAFHDNPHMIAIISCFWLSRMTIQSEKFFKAALLTLLTVAKASQKSGSVRASPTPAFSLD